MRNAESKKKVREVTPSQALSKLMMLCSKAERSSGYVCDMLEKWGVARCEHPAILSELVKQRYVDNRRYAMAFTRDKMYYNGWGRRKVASMLKMKGVELVDIEAAFDECCMDVMGQLQKILLSKNRILKEENHYKRKDKLIRFAISRGFDMDDILSAVDGILDEKE